MSDEDRIKLTVQELERIVEKKVKKRVDERLGEAKGSDRERGDAASGVSRRSFLKKLGAGAIGLGALGLSSAAGFNVRSNDLQVFADNGDTDFQVEDSFIDTHDNAIDTEGINTENFQITENSSTNSLDFNYTG